MIRIKFDHGPELSLTPCCPASPSPPSPYDFLPLSKSPSDSATTLASYFDQPDDIFTPEIKQLQEIRLRKGQEIGQILKQFTREIAGEARPPKLENLRYRVMRSLKKFIRRLLQDKKVSKKGLMAISGELDPVVLDQIQEYCQLHRQVLTTFASLRNGPCVDHRRSGTNTGHNTYNNNYMREIFKQEEVRETYSLYIRLLFSKDQVESLCHRFKIRCCDERHSEVCEGKWREFRKILVEFLGADVD
jgi:hypothetical protein